VRYPPGERRFPVITRAARVRRSSPCVDSRAGTDRGAGAVERHLPPTPLHRWRPAGVRVRRRSGQGDGDGCPHRRQPQHPLALWYPRRGQGPELARLQFGHPTCPLSQATRPPPEPDAITCPRWRRGVVAWLVRHPEVSTVLLAQFVGGVGVVTPAGRSPFETAANGYVEAWRALPSSVRHVIVIRDNPCAHRWTPGCVERAMAPHAPAGRACATLRSTVLEPDPAAVAARRLGPPRVHLVDFTRYFCSARRCYPVIGGVLVHQDGNHMTAAFNRSLGPHLLREVNRILPRKRH
jgi:hypothetical protein